MFLKSRTLITPPKKNHPTAKTKVHIKKLTNVFNMPLILVPYIRNRVQAQKKKKIDEKVLNLSLVLSLLMQ